MDAEAAEEEEDGGTAAVNDDDDDDIKLDGVGGGELEIAVDDKGTGAGKGVGATLGTPLAISMLDSAILREYTNCPDDWGGVGP